MFFFTSGILFWPTLTCLCLGEQIMPNNTKTMHAPKIGLDNVPNKVHWGVFMPLLQNWFLIALGSWKDFIYKLFAYSLDHIIHFLLEMIYH